MKIFNKNRIIPLIMALIMLMVLTFNSACSTFNTKDITTSAKEADTYIRVRINLPHKRIYNFTVHENYLYYICYEEPDDTAYEIPYMGRNPNELQALLVRLNLDNPDSFTITPLDVPADQYIQTVAVDNDGYIHILTSQCIEEDTYVSYGNMFWYKIDSEDSISKIVEYSIDDYLLPTQLIIGNDGNAYISAFCTYEESIILVINPSGDLIAKFPEYSLFMFKDDEGNVYTHHYTTFIALHGFTTMVVSLIDLETANLVEIIDITKLAGVRAGFTGLGKKAEVFFLANTDGIYSYSMESQTKIEHYTWDEIGMGRISNDARVFPIDNQILFVDIPEGRGGGAFFEGNTFRIIRPKTSEDFARLEAKPREWEP
ncbi:MAG: hypothetical protein FWE14_07280, partial [Lachnospiraceae bacterium]|nr:hypothetical protein [Lachnospiraceae bacterium]